MVDKLREDAILTDWGKLDIPSKTKFNGFSDFHERYNYLKANGGLK